MIKKNLRFLIRGTLSSYITMLILMSILAIGAAIGTFIENDFGTEKARFYVYNSLWYEITLVLTVVNMLTVIMKMKMYKRILIFTFHFSFIIILIGAGVTRYFGFEGSLSIREGQSNDQVIVNNENIKLPFSVKLNKFTITRYPGSHSPSAYASTIILSSKTDNTQINTTISMNKTLDYEGYRLFQTSYDTDKKGTILTVNKDPGKNITYLGYALLFTGLILNLLHSKSRFRFLLKSVNKESFTALLIFSLLIPDAYTDNKISDYSETYLKDHRENSLNLSKQFARLMVQSRMGRTKPLDTLNREILRKLTGKSVVYGMNPNQIVMGILSRPELWKNIPLIKITSDKLKKEIGLSSVEKLTSFNSLFNSEGKYHLKLKVEEASKLAPFKRGVYEKDVLRVDERISIFFMVYKGTLLKIFPIPEDKTNRWMGFNLIWDQLNTITAQSLQNSTRKFIDSIFARNYQDAEQPLLEIISFQKKHGSQVYLTDSKIAAEILYNQLSLFPKLMVIYLLLGSFLLIIAFISIQKPMISNGVFHKLILTISFILLIANIFPLALRVYISNHAPMSDTYESLIYIAFSSVAAGLLFFRKSLFVLSSSMLMAGIFLFIAHLGKIDPEITNLVPVLKSFWLSVHVSIITASYGFLGIGCLTGFITILLFIVPNGNINIQKNIKQLTHINEAYLIFGFTMLIIGNFLGAIWANESWGRYWGWDPKETWAYISIIIYILVIHLRLMKKIYSDFLFAVCSVLSFSSILMTYFGVNFYLSGKHSYATGDPILLPNWAYIIISVLVLIITLAYMNKQKSLK